MSGYFEELTASTPTRVWVNNPTRAEVDLARAKGAVGCTTNPAFGGNLARRATDEVVPLIDALLAEMPEADDAAVADRLQERLVGEIASRFGDLHEASGRRLGFVSLQGPPERDVDAEAIWIDAVAARRVAINVVPKIPATKPGLAALARVVGEGWPVIVTEVFSVDQLIATCETYERAAGETGERPPFFISPITGIFGDHLKKVAAQEGLDVPAGVPELAGLGLARRCATVVGERGWTPTLLFGGARNPADLTGLVGDRHHATINWSTFEEIAALGPAVEHTINQPLEPDAERQLLAMFPDVCAAFTPGSLDVEHFEGFGPVQHFRDVFVAGRRSVLDLVAQRRSTIAGEARPTAAALLDR
jgi:transaldolase